MADDQERETEDDEATGHDRRPSMTPGVADEHFAANVRANRERLGMSQADLAREMSERGWPYYPQTVHRIETGTRKVNVGEAEALARVFSTTIERMTWPDPVNNSVAWFNMFISRADTAFEQIAGSTYQLLFARLHIERGIESAVRRGLLDEHEQVRLAVGEGGATLEHATPERAIELGRSGYERDHGDPKAIAEEGPSFEEMAADEQG